MYTAKNIEVLEGLEGIRKRPGVYVGDINSTAMFQIIKEVCDNGIDEYLCSTNDTIYIKIEEDTITVADKGRGIPVEDHKKTGFSTLTTILTRIHAGGKFSNKEMTVGTHGIGVSATNALSSVFEIWTYRTKDFKEDQNLKGKSWYYQKFEKGLPVTEVKVARDKPLAIDKGTIIKFTPDKSIFKNFYKIPINDIKKWLHNIKYLCPNLKITLETKEKIDIYETKLGITQWVKDFVEDKKLNNIGKMFNLFDENSNIQVALQWTDYSRECINTYVNCCHTSANGSHYIGLCKAISKSLKNFSQKSFSKEDLRIGLIGLVHIKISDPTFSTQTKEKLTNSETESLVKEVLTPKLIDFFKKNKTLTNTIIAKAIKLKEARDLYKKNKEAIKDLSLVNKHKKHILPGVLLTAIKCKPYERELFICEGKSAKGTLKDARDPSFQEVLPLKGKFTNVVKFTDHKIFNNQDIKNIFTAIGSNKDKKQIYDCDYKQARVGKIILLPDQDADGAHIRCLLLSLFIKYMKKLIDKGMVYVVDAPLFVTSYGDKKYYGNTLKDIRKQLPNKAKTYITRMKGWGEASKEDMKYIAMNPNTRKLFKTTLEDNCIKKINELMGNDSFHRKELLGI